MPLLTREFPNPSKCTDRVLIVKFWSLLRPTTQDPTVYGALGISGFSQEFLDTVSRSGLNSMVKRPERSHTIGIFTAGRCTYGTAVWFRPSTMLLRITERPNRVPHAGGPHNRASHANSSQYNFIRRKVCWKKSHEAESWRNKRSRWCYAVVFKVQTWSRKRARKTLTGFRSN